MKFVKLRGIAVAFATLASTVLATGAAVKWR